MEIHNKNQGVPYCSDYLLGIIHHTNSQPDIVLQYIYSFLHLFYATCFRIMGKYIYLRVHKGVAY